MRTLVTGGAGFIGSHLVEALVERGDEVLVADDLSTGRLENLAAVDGRIEFRRCDIAERGVLHEQTGAFAPEAIFHVAGQMDARKAIADPTHDGRINVLGTIEALEVAREHGARLVFTSTGGVSYGEGAGRRLPFVETDETLPETAYGVSKLAAEKYVSFYKLLHRVPAVSLRLGNVYGPRQDPHGEAGVIAIFCGRLLDGERPVVFGDGEQTRDYVYVDDIIAGLIGAGDALADGIDLADVYNLGTGAGTSVLRLVELLSALTGTDPDPEFQPPRTGEVSQVYISAEAAKRDFGWEPAADLEASLERTYEWARTEGQGIANPSP